MYSRMRSCTRPSTYSTIACCAERREAVSFCLAHCSRLAACEWPAQPANQPAAHSDPVRTRAPHSQPRRKKIRRSYSRSYLTRENSEAVSAISLLTTCCRRFLRQHQANIVKTKCSSARNGPPSTNFYSRAAEGSR